MIQFAFDDPNRPNLVFQDHDHDNAWPRTVPCRLLMYLKKAAIKHQLVDTDQADQGAWYPIGLGWFDHSLDYFDLVPINARQKLSNGSMKLLFYYHEGDNPTNIKTRLDLLANKHKLPGSCYLFISANTGAQNLENFMYFPDHEFFFRHVNRSQAIQKHHSGPRKYHFTALNRTHKWWRASAMADLYRQGILNHSLWSYNTVNDPLGAEIENPLELDLHSGWRLATQEFLSITPHQCDNLNHNEHNHHGLVNIDLYTDSYCHLIFETHFDADQSQGTFLTEKTFKAIKFAQPFVVIGPQGSLAELRRLGYRVFDNVINNDYDNIANNTQRWLQIKKTIMDINQSIGPDWLELCRSDIEHNLQMFVSRCWDPLNTLIKEIQCH